MQSCAQQSIEFIAIVFIAPLDMKVHFVVLHYSLCAFRFFFSLQHVQRIKLIDKRSIEQMNADLLNTH